MMDLRALYEETIQDHERHPRNFHSMEYPTHRASGNNPLCGDRVVVFVKLNGDRIEDVSFQGKRLRDLHGFIFDDDRGVDGKDCC